MRGREYGCTMIKVYIFSGAKVGSMIFKYSNENFQYTAVVSSLSTHLNTAAARAVCNSTPATVKRMSPFDLASINQFKYISYKSLHFKGLKLSAED